MYNSIRKASFCFMQRYGHTPSRVLLSKNQYLTLVNEMYGLQQEFLIKNNSVMGLKVSISMDVDDEFMLISTHKFLVVHFNWKEVLYITKSYKNNILLSYDLKGVKKMKNQLINLIDSALHDGTKILTITSEKNKNNQEMKCIAEDFIEGFYYSCKVELLDNGIKITF